jgi:hypothetical protein
MSTTTHPTTLREQEASARKRAANRHRNADELWALFSRTHDPMWQAQIQTEAHREDRAAEQVTEAANHYADQAATAEAELDAEADLNPPPLLDRANPTPHPDSLPDFRNNYDSRP